MEMIKSLKAAHPNSPLSAESGKRFKDGTTKTKLRLVYEHAFDSALRTDGIVSPEKFRED
jgi:hypothetical protein